MRVCHVFPFELSFVAVLDTHHSDITFGFLAKKVKTLSTVQTFFFCFKVGLGFARTNVRIRWNPIYKAFHRIRVCGNEPIVR